MRFGRTHDILTSYSMPKTKKKIIRKINHEIDNPNPFYKKFKKSTGLKTELFRLPGINYNNHRKAGHDWTDAIYFTAKYGQEGFEAWMNHQAQDMFSDMMLKQYGSFARNIFEDSILEFSKAKYRNFR